MGELTTADLIKQTAAWGHRVSVRQIERWRSAGLLPKAKRRGKGRGTVWLHPPETAAWLRILLEVRKPRERLEETAVRMWLRGCEMPLAELRKKLPRAMALHTRMRKQVTRHGITGVGERLADHVQRTKASQVRFGIATFDEEAYDRIAAMGEAIAALFANPQLPMSAEIGEHLEAALNLDGDEQMIVAALGGNVSAELRTALPLVSTSDSAVVSASDEELLEARQLWRNFWVAVELARKLPERDRRRSFLLRMDEQLDSSLGMSIMLQAARRARSNGATDPLGQAEALREALTIGTDRMPL